MANNRLRVSRGFKPPKVKRLNQGVAAFHAYDWYFNWLSRRLARVRRVFLVPCAATKPIYESSLHRTVYQRYAAVYGRGREVLVVSEPVVLIRYHDLYILGKNFYYDFPPKLLRGESRELFVRRLCQALSGKDIIGCLPRHHASLIIDAIGDGWENHWSGDLFAMMKKASRLKNCTPR